MLERVDPEVHEILQHEGRDPSVQIDLRPGRNFLSQAVLEVLGSALSDFYVEGFPGQRFTRGSAAAESVECLGNERLKSLFGAEEATIQPATHSCAVSAVLAGMLNPGDTILAPAPGQGASLVLGHKTVLWAERFRFVRYGPGGASQAFDSEAILSLARRSSPSLVVVSAFPFPRQQDWEFWRNVADRSSALLVVDLGVAAGLVPAGVIPNPMVLADIVTGATHGILRGPPGGFILCRKTLCKKLYRGLFPLLQAGAGVNQIAGKTVALKEAGTPEYKSYVRQSMKSASRLSGLLQAGGIELLTGGTDFHYFSLHTRPLGFTGIEAEARLREKGIAVQRIQFPCSQGCSNRGDAILLGTQAITLRGVGEGALEALAEKILTTLR